MFSNVSNSIREAQKQDIARLNAILQAEGEISSDSDDDLLELETENVKECLAEQNTIPDISIVEFNEFSSYEDQIKPVLEQFRNVAKVDRKTVLALNELQQKLLIEGLRRFQILLNECNKRLEDVNRRKMELIKNKLPLKAPSWYRCGVPYFKTRDGQYCPVNSDVIEKRQRGELSLIDLPPIRFWLLDEKELLRKVVCEESKRIRIAELEEKLKRTEVDIDVIKEELRDWKMRKVEECVYPVTNRSVPIDWLKISVQYMRGRHTDDECKAMWYITVHPHLNNSSYGPKEFKRLQEIAERHKYQDWDSIARELDTGRSGYHCFLYHQLNVFEQRQNQKWTPTEDAYLLEVIDRCRIGNYIPWGKVSYYMKTRLKSQIYARYQNTLCEGLRKGKFSPQEDLLVMALIRKIGPNYPKVATYIPGRTASQIRERHINNLQYAGSESHEWTLDEDKQIIEFVKKNGTKKWAELNDIINTPYVRSRTTLRHRWRVISKYLDSNYEGDLEKLPRMRKKNTFQKYDTYKLENIINYLNGMDEANENNPYDIKAVTQLAGETILTGKDSQEKFVNYYINSFYFTHQKEVFHDIDIINGLYLIQLINGKIDTNSLNLRKYKYLASNERFTLEIIKRIVDEINKTPCMQLTLFFNNFWRQYYGRSYATAWNISNNISTFIPCFLSKVEYYERVVLVCKSISKFIGWEPSELDTIYKKAGVKYRYMRNETEDNRILFERNIESEIKTRVLTQTCTDFLSELKSDSVVTLARSTKTETCKVRILSLFTLESMRWMRDRLLAEVHVINQKQLNMEMEVEESTEQQHEPEQQQQEQKQQESPPATVKRKRGRPRKILPGKRLKYPVKIENNPSTSKISEDNSQEVVEFINCDDANSINSD